eukprot:1829204-Rhodomonas_salina.1
MTQNDREEGVEEALAVEFALLRKPPHQKHPTHAPPLTTANLNPAFRATPQPPKIHFQRFHNRDEVPADRRIVAEGALAVELALLRLQPLELLLDRHAFPGTTQQKQRQEDTDEDEDERRKKRKRKRKRKINMPVSPRDAADMSVNTKLKHLCQPPTGPAQQHKLLHHPSLSILETPLSPSSTPSLSVSISPYISPPRHRSPDLACT